MSVDLKRLPADEEVIRQRGRRIDKDGDPNLAGSMQNVLDALNWYRCLALDYQGQLARAKAENGVNAGGGS